MSEKGKKILTIGLIAYLILGALSIVHIIVPDFYKEIFGLGTYIIHMSSLILFV